jgi:ABC-2 type transport system permease protein
VSVAHDAAGGFFDRLRSMSVGGVAVLGGHVVASLARNAASSTLVIAVAFGLGFRSHADVARWLVAIGLLAAFVLAVSWLAAALGLLAGSPEAANGFTFVLMFVPYASSAFVPVRTMPGWLQGFAANQPITPLAEALRALLVGGRVGADVAYALAWCGGILGVAVIASALLYRRTAR